VLDFEDGVDAFGGKVDTRLVVEEKRRIKLVVNGHVNLAAAVAVGVHDERARSPVAHG